MNLNELRDYCGEAANRNGWHDDYPEDTPTERLWIAAKAGLIAAEAHEAIEELRNGQAPTETYLSEGGKPEGFGVELADVIIRTLDLAWVTGVDIEHEVMRKLRANDKRGTRHGGKKL